MNQQTLTSGKENDSSFLESSSSRCFSFVFSLPNETVNTPASDVRFVFSNTKPIDIRFFLDDNGEIHSSLRIVPESKQKTKQENMLISKKEIKENNEKTLEEIKNTSIEKIDLESTPEIPKVRKRGRPKGSKNKKTKTIPDEKKFQQEWFETNAEFKARVAEEMKVINAQAA
ncbi:hypothetical protein [Nitrosopumilus maritimus]|uniref:Uncharacterized protein n=1 Tax=Nitrosopumilus maritimus (strain SCM1) TaxID=436308 RepID=A9A1G3_NITMS|nr:hypothetical protein [Nitrosopumilus maritimus]ABX13142.1 hypothetical protein Nmar_1246 [Nitrosopumilus maritimus SCM1]